jgi:hypothetical protein
MKKFRQPRYDVRGKRYDVRGTKYDVRQPDLRKEKGLLNKETRRVSAPPRETPYIRQYSSGT